MPHVAIQPGQVAAGKALSALLMRRIRDNILAISAYSQSCLAQMDSDTGHRHTTGSVTTDYPFTDRIRTVTGVNDQLTFKFAGGSYALTEYTITLDAGERTFSAHASHTQSKMRSAVDSGSPGSVPLSFGYITAEGENRGRFRFRHTGSSDSPHGRVFWLLFGTGASASRSAAPLIGFPDRDCKGALGWVGNSSFMDGLLLDRITIGHGGKLDTGAFVKGAFITRTFKNGIVPRAAFPTGAVTNGKIQNGAITGPKLGAGKSSIGGPQTISDSGSTSFAIDVPNGGGSRDPAVRVVCTGSTPAAEGDLEITSISWGGIHWHVGVQNNTSSSLQADIVGY